MKKLGLIWLAIALAFCLVCCGATEASSEPQNESYLEKMDDYDIYIWTDKETGVQYIVYRDKSSYAGMGGITPRLNADGTLYTEEGK